MNKYLNDLMDDSNVKHRDIIITLLEGLRTDWMDDDDFKNVVEQFLTKTGIDLNYIDCAIETGIKHGYSPEQQLKILKQLFTTV